MKNFEKFLKEPTDDELNKRLHKIMELCWHELSDIQEGTPFKCKHCTVIMTKLRNFNIDFLTWEGFGIVWEWLQTRHGYEAFMHKHGYGSNDIGWYLKERYISPRALAEAVIEFFEGASHD